MVDQWYFSKGEKKFGPYSSTQLKQLADNGKILPSDTVWKEGIERGVLAAKVKHLFSVSPTKSPPVQTAKVPSASASTAPPASHGPSPTEAESLDDSIAQAGTDQRRADAESKAGEMDSASVSAERTPSAGAAATPSPVAEAPGKHSAENQNPSAQGAAPATTPPPPKPEAKKPPPGTLAKSTRTFRVTGAIGAIILGQDGLSVRYRKKCPKCGTEDNSVRTMMCRSGVNRDRYFCQKCRKLQQVEIHGSL
jgi:hypothetical protein